MNTRAQPDKLTMYSSFTDEELQEAMKAYLGIQYKYGGATKNGFDCSGFVKVIYDKYFSIDLPHQSSQQSASPQLEKVPLDQLRTGDLLFFSINSKKRAINHVGIYMSDGKFIHSGRSKGVSITSLNKTYWRSKFLWAKRVTSQYEDKPGTIFLDMEFIFDQEDTRFVPIEKTDLEMFQTAMYSEYTDHTDIRNSFNSFELGYSGAATSRLTSSLSFFRRSFLPDEKNPSFSTLPDDNDPEGAKTVYAHGVTLSGRFNILDNFAILPSVSYLDYSQDTDTENLPRLALDLKYGLFSSKEKWALTGGIHMPLQRYESSVALVDFQDSNIGLSLTYQQQFSDNMFFMFTGKNYDNFGQGFNEYPSDFSSKNKNFSFIFKIFY